MASASLVIFYSSIETRPRVIRQVLDGVSRASLKDHGYPLTQNMAENELLLHTNQNKQYSTSTYIKIQDKEEGKHN